MSRVMYGLKDSDLPFGLPQRLLELRRLERAQEVASTYESWAAAARKHDHLSGREKWKDRLATGLYDYALIAAKLERLRALRAAGDHRGLVYEIEEGVHGNIGGMGKAALHNKARFGTKQLITDYVEELAGVLLHLESVDALAISPSARLDLFRRASHCFGRTALMMSSGGMLMFFHFGVVKSFLEQGVLPNVISGSSAGSVVAAVLGTHADRELKDVLMPENLYFGEPWIPNRLERWTGLRRIYGNAAFEQTFSRLVPDLTFREAFELTGRRISISVSPCERHHSPRLLNAITSPHVLIRSAVRASCSVPGLFEPVQLEARDTEGRSVPFLNSRWIDGVFAADLPAKQLARLYGTNHYIVSYVNPLLLPTFRDHRTRGSGMDRPATLMFKDAARQWLGVTDRLIGRYAPKSSLGTISKIANDMLSQQFVGDINITPKRRLFSPHRLLSPYAPHEIEELMLEGERRAWPRIEMIRTASKVSRTLDEILSRADVSDGLKPLSIPIDVPV